MVSIDAYLNQKYSDVDLSEQQVAMLTDIVETDLPLKRVLLHIAKHADINKDEEVMSGISIKGLADSIVLERRVQQKKNKSKKFNIEKTNIDRKHVERITDTLLKMSLCYFVSVPPSKLIYISRRGRQIAKEIVRRKKEQ
ncbi:hypothetical protein B1A99_24715 [Cohnella sp. CIP 111063]|uniref:hypothetical protein n=1 Tax=Cohnella TaxID=329857 RepID=UPI000B8C3F87|nr:MULTISPECIES: hypothetical protein [Cohnella]OXS54986.1 hypothetical protein B1A99_24715 [Cohnella sp. CIP 111063]